MVVGAGAPQHGGKHPVFPCHGGHRPAHLQLAHAGRDIEPLLQIHAGGYVLIQPLEIL